MIDIEKIKHRVFLQQKASIDCAKKLKDNARVFQSLKLQALSQLKTSPLSVINILESEIASDLDVQEFIGELIKNIDEVFKIIVTSPKRLWETSYPITTAITLKATYNTELANILGNVLDDCDPIKITLKMVGRIK